MSKEAVEGFYKKVMADSSLQEKFKAAADEVRARLKEEASFASSGELSDDQLESVAGGYVSYGSSLLCGYCGSQSGTTGPGSIPSTAPSSSTLRSASST